MVVLVINAQPTVTNVLVVQPVHQLFIVLLEPFLILLTDVFHVLPTVNHVPLLLAVMLVSVIQIML